MRTIFTDQCDTLVTKHTVFAEIIETYGYPTPHTRPADFTTLVRLILEQQVSLASAKATFDKLKFCVEAIEPAPILLLSDEVLRASGISRQKSLYLRTLATAILDKTLDLDALSTLSDEVARAKLTQIKGIGTWTADVFLMECLGRLDIFPIGDVALRNAMKVCLGLPAETTHEELITLADAYRPLRSVATFLFWHDYLGKKKIDIHAILS
jgi:DNA-3-methyladenine glycosylase II